VPSQILDHETSNVTLEALLEAEGTQQRIIDRLELLPLAALRVADKVFQWRHFNSELGVEEGHIKELARVLESSSAPLDAILVTAIGTSFYVVDGHHRLLAYRIVKWSQPVPVDYFEGTVQEARLEALRLNIKNKLPMTSEDKFEAAWTFVKEGSKLSKSQIAEMTTISERTIGYMRKVLKEYPSAIDCSWNEAKRLQWEPKPEIDRDDWLQEEARKVAKQILHNVGPKLTQRADVIALALAMIDSRLPRLLVAQWPDAVQAYNDELEQYSSALYI
jgi:hypothetical protein